MDGETLGAAIALLNKRVPKATEADEGKILVVDENGEWVPGMTIEAVISVSEHTLVVTAGEGE